MYKISLFFVIVVFAYGCSDSNSISNSDNDTIASIDDDSNNGSGSNNSTGNPINWIVPINTVNGNFSPFPLAKNPSFTRAKDVDFISDNSLVAMVSFNNEVRVYPYKYISRFESINDVMDGKNIAMTYCPITESALCWDRNYKSDLFTLRASGYLHFDNVILHDKNSDTFWSQMLVKCIRGKYAGETHNTFNFIETTWETVIDNFANALVFTNSSVNNNDGNSKSNGVNKDIRDGDGVFGIINFRSNKKIKSEIFAYQFESFNGEVKLFSKNISNQNIIVVGNEELRFITAFINDRNATFTAVNDQFPIVMEDDGNNKWNLFGIAVSGPRKGQQLQSPVSFVASWWSWNQMYDDIVLQN